MSLSPIIGAIQLALGQARGIARFGNTPQAFLASLAPWIALPLVGILLSVFNGNSRQAIGALLFIIVGMLGPAVVSHALASRWGREPLWLRYATAFNWCQWAVIAAFLLIVFALQATDDDDIDPETTVRIILAVVSIYGLWLNWTLARAGLDLSRGRASAFVVVLNAGTFALAMLPQVIGWLLR